MPLTSDFYKEPASRESIFENVAYDSTLFNGAINWTIDKEVGKNAQILAKTPTAMAGTSPQYTIRIYSYWKGIQIQTVQSIQFLNIAAGFVGGSIQIPAVADSIGISITKTGTHTGGSLSVFMKEF